MVKTLLLAAVLAIAPLTPALAAVDPETGLDDDAVQTPAMPSAEQLKQLQNMKVTGAEKSLQGTGVSDIGSAMRLIKIGQALKARKPIASEDIQFLRTYLKKMGMGDPSQAATMQKLDQVLEKLEKRIGAPSEEDQMMKDMADGADMDDLPKLDD
jgi:hypothetical protein